MARAASSTKTFSQVVRERREAGIMPKSPGRAYWGLPDVQQVELELGQSALGN